MTDLFTQKKSFIFRTHGLTCLTVACALWVSSVSAQSVLRQSTQYPADLREFSKLAVSTQSGQSVTDTLVKSPWGALTRSMMIPGWGQTYNQNVLKALIFVLGDASMLSMYFVKNKDVSRIERQRSVIKKQLAQDPFLTVERRTILNSRHSNLTGDLDIALNNRNLFGWLFAISHLAGMIDAFVDAHLYNFDDKIKMRLDTSDELLQLRISYGF